MDVPLGDLMRIAELTLFLSLTVALCGCRERPRSISVRGIQSPVPREGLTPQVTPVSDKKWILSWQSPLTGGGWSFSMAMHDANGWSEVRQIARGSDLSMFSADLPGVAVLSGDALLAYWELKDARDGDPYATSIRTAVSKDEGRSWSRPAQPYNGPLAGQHSFISSFSIDGGLGLAWLDAEERSKIRHSMTEHGGHDEGGGTGSIGLRYAALDGEGRVTGSAFIDPITCECCPTSAAISTSGPVMVYRGRRDPPGTKPSEVRTDRATVRDVYITRLSGGKWTKPHLVHADNWVINACPDNGPAVDAAGNSAAVAWWTRANDQPQVLVAFSSNAGDTFGPAIRVDAGNAEGQVTVTLLPDGKGAVVGWLEEGQTWARFVSATGHAGSVVALGPSPRHSRLPRWIAQGGGVLAVWTAKVNESRQVRIAQLTL